MRCGFGLVFAVALAACTLPTEAEVEAPEAVEIAALDAPSPPPEARRADEFDTTTEEQRKAALDPAENGVLIGRAVLTLGDPGRAGFWVESELVSQASEGRIELEDGGKSIEVALLPTSGSGRISLAALRLLEVPLTAIVEVDVFENQ
ncbi:MAG: hypothetical protein HKP37_02110 [Boseongicola sp.]|nr:hypothetical protein [Boseongicola sp.]NNL17512.1 hypothetical protein [Boseongicola sp.]